jgi:putative ABC transport system permease protein
MLELVFANLRARPLRTLISVLGVALGVILVMLFTGLTEGISDDMARRSANWKAEIVFTREGAMELTSSTMNVSTRYEDRLREIEGVESTVSVGRYITASPKGRWGIQHLEGVDWEPFARMNGMEIISGRSAVANDEVVVDEKQFKEDDLKLGDRITLFGEKEYAVVGVYSPSSGARIKMTLESMQEILEAPNRATYILVKLKDGAEAEKVAARIDSELPGNKINLTSNLIVDAQDRVPGLSTFLRTLVGLGAFVSTVFVLLSMYTTVTERRKEIGILKSLGASRGFIVRVIEGEALLIGLLGIAAGGLISVASATLIWIAFELPFKYDLGWILTAVSIALAGSLIGALYPAWRASGIDPVEVMVNE